MKLGFIICLLGLHSMFVWIILGHSTCFLSDPFVVLWHSNRLSHLLSYGNELLIIKDLFASVALVYTSKLTFLRQLNYTVTNVWGCLSSFWFFFFFSSLFRFDLLYHANQINTRGLAVSWQSHYNQTNIGGWFLSDLFMYAFIECVGSSILENVPVSLST